MLPALRLCFYLLLAATLRSAAPPSWDVVEGKLSLQSQGWMEILVGHSQEPFRVRLRESESRIEARVVFGRKSRSCTSVGPLPTPGGLGRFGLREDPGEGFPQNRSVMLPEETTEAGLPIPVGYASIGDWEVWLIQWDHGGCGLAGLFVTNLVIGRHHPSNTWEVRAGLGPEFRLLEPSEGNQPAFCFEGAERTPNNCWIQEYWRFSLNKGEARAETVRRTYRWFCGATVTDSPRRARHWGHQEVAWHLKEVGRMGGIAEGFADSPRPSSDFDGIFPAKDRIAFTWRSLIVIAAKNGTRRFLNAKGAAALAAKGGWDVVLERRNGQPTATWLVEHEKDFPHSTPPK